MVTPLISGISGGLAAVAVIASATLLIIPGPPPIEQDIWIDNPVAGRILQQGDITVTLHAKQPGSILGSFMTGGPIRSFRIEITPTDGAPNPPDRNDTSPEFVQYGREPNSDLWFGSVVWEDAQPGVYSLRPSYPSATGSTYGPSVTVTVVGVGGGPIVEPTATPAATASPTPTPTATATPVPTVAPIVPPVPTPTPTLPPPPAPVVPPTGAVSRAALPATGQFANRLTAYQVTPSSASVSIQVQSVPAINAPYNPGGAWADLGCGNLAPVGNGTSTCSVDFQAGSSTGDRTMWARVVVTIAGQAPLTVYSTSWQYSPFIGLASSERLIDDHPGS